MLSWISSENFDTEQQLLGFITRNDNKKSLVRKCPGLNSLAEEVTENYSVVIQT
jgi:hypothetical protein